MIFKISATNRLFNRFFEDFSKIKIDIFSIFPIDIEELFGYNKYRYFKHISEFCYSGSFILRNTSWLI